MNKVTWIDMNQFLLLSITNSLVLKVLNKKFVLSFLHAKWRKEACGLLVVICAKGKQKVAQQTENSLFIRFSYGRHVGGELKVKSRRALTAATTLPPVPCSAPGSAARRWPVSRSPWWWREGSGARSHRPRQRGWNCPPCSLCCRARSRCVQVSATGGQKKKDSVVALLWINMKKSGRA